MSLYYFDASALVKYYVTKPGSAWVMSLIEAKEASTGVPLHSVFVGTVSIVEVSAAFSILYRQRKISRKQRDNAFAHFLADLEDQFILVSVSSEEYYEGAELTKRHPLKAYDAMQLAVALHQSRLLRTHELTLAFVCGDNALLKAALSEKLPIENPFDHVVPEDRV